ncbi:patched family protein, partial [Oesophagostomum dentatum]
MISALTNMSADAVGAFTSSPEITLLCYGNAACIFVDFIYQITLYSAVMVLAGHFEVENERERSLTQRVECGADETSDNLEQVQRKNFMEDYEFYLVPLVSFRITNKFFNAAVFIVWIAYLLVSIKGLTQMPINLTPKKLFAADSSLIEMDDLRVSYVIPHFTLATIFVNRPGNLSDQSRLARLNSFVAEMESLPGAWGKPSSNYFLRDFAVFEKEMKEIETEDGEKITKEPKTLNLKELPAFLKWPEYEFWRGFIRFKDNSTELERFFLTTAYHGEALREWMNRDKMLKSWRTVVDRYAPEFNVTVYYDDSIYLDLIENMP